MDNNYEKIPIKEGGIESESEKIRQLLENEKQTNPEYRECLENLKQEFDRRVAKANIFVQKLSEKIGSIDWFIVPPVMSRTDYGYMSDIDLVIAHDSDTQEPEYENYVDDVFIMPQFISRGKIDEIGTKYSEISEWHNEKLSEEKPKGKAENQPIDVSLLEDKLRYSIESKKREQIRNYRLLLANHFIEMAKPRIGVISWNVSGSTVTDKDKFSVCSDIDLDILVDPQTPEQEDEISFYLHNYLKYKFAEDYNTKMCFTEMTLKDIKRMATINSDMKKFYEKEFDIKLE